MKRTRMVPLFTFVGCLLLSLGVFIQNAHSGFSTYSKSTTGTVDYAPVKLVCDQDVDDVILGGGLGLGEGRGDKNGSRIDYISTYPSSSNEWTCQVDGKPDCYATCGTADFPFQTQIVTAKASCNKTTVAECDVDNGWFLVGGGVSSSVPDLDPNNASSTRDSRRCTNEGGDNVEWVVSANDENVEGWRCGVNKYEATCYAVCMKEGN